MPAKKPLPIPALLPIDHYALTAEDETRFAEERALGMVAPNDPCLRQVANAISVRAIGTPKIMQLINRLLATAGSQQKHTKATKKRRMLVGLAAPQIGESQRVIVVDTTISPERKKSGQLECFINPEIIWRSRETEEGREGCFSAGPVWGLVRRPIAVKIRALNTRGESIERIFEGFTARIVQHEIDHLQGIRFPDRIRSDKKRHWVHTEELALYPGAIHRWPRICTMERWRTMVTRPRE